MVKEVQEVGNAAQVARRHELRSDLVYRWVKQTKHGICTIINLINVTA
ncbi:hypothetical protein [Tumebacillus avium]